MNLTAISREFFFVGRDIHLNIKTASTYRTKIIQILTTLATEISIDWHHKQFK